MTDYTLLKKMLVGLVEGETNFLANASNFTALLWQEMKDINWVGFYFYDGKELVLSVFQGKPACLRIPKGKGVCGTAYTKNETLIVADVHQFEGHIACDSASNSEIVIPIKHNGRTIAVLDIDSPVKNRFAGEDARGLQDLINVLIESSDIEKLSMYYHSR